MYCYPSHVRTRLPALISQVPSVDKRIQESIDSANAQIDAVLRKLGVSQLPLDEFDPLLTSIASALAAADVIDGSLSGGGEDNPTPLSVRLREWAERQLEKIVAGDIVLDGITPPQLGDDGTRYIPAMHSHPFQTQELDCWDVMGP